MSFSEPGRHLPNINREAARLTGEQISFSFGANWRKLIERLDVAQVTQAARGLSSSFNGAGFSGERFIDIGCGSGLNSLCAFELGASEIVSVDVDPEAVACTEFLRERAGNPKSWSILRGSALNRGLIQGLGPASRVYSWGVLHHTGAMWKAIDNLLQIPTRDGLCCLAIYNRPHFPRIQISLKRLYNRLPDVLKPPMTVGYALAVLSSLLVVRHRNPFRYVDEYGKKSRGMSYWRDVEDWLGGLPFEFASSNDIREYVTSRGYELAQEIIRPPGACNEYLLRRSR